METKEIKQFGHCGLRVELNVMDQYEITHAVERMRYVMEQIDDFLRDKLANGEPTNDNDSMMLREVFDEMDHIRNFLMKLQLQHHERATVFEAPSEFQEPVELLEK